MTISYHDFNTLFNAATAEQDKFRFIAEWSSSYIFFPEGEDSPDIDAAELSDALSNIWDVGHLNTRDIRQHMGLTQAAFAERFCIRLRTAQNWETEHREVPRHVILLMANEAGMLHVKRE